MGVRQPVDAGPAFAEDIRLVIWDLDETFWNGTLSEGGIRHRMDTERLVLSLARRGIMSSICSKNDFDAVARVLRARGIWDRFIFPSIDWTPKGPRIAAMLKRIGLRAPSVLFIDDNALNRAEARHSCPGLNVSGPDAIPRLAVAPQLAGRPDPQLQRLGQYKLKERKAAAEDVFTESGTEFLRQAGITVALEYDVEAHLDRAVELINRTNQLNFTRNRLPDDPAAAAAMLAGELSHNTTDAALIRVRDRYGDYGFAGFYLCRRKNNRRQLRHFCFSCRTLGMGIESWVYDLLGRPDLGAPVDVLSDPRHPPVPVDWIALSHGSGEGTEGLAEPGMRYDHIIARGGCDLASLMHYVAPHGARVTEEFNAPRNGQMFRRDHSAFLMPALGDGLTPAQLAAAAGLGYERADFDSVLAAPLAGRTLVLLSFWADADIPLYRHAASGLRVPYWLVGAQHHDLTARRDLAATVARSDIQRARLAHLRDAFLHDGILPGNEMRARYAAILDHLTPGADVVLVLANERGPAFFRDRGTPPHPRHRALNDVLREVAAGRDRVVLIDPADHIAGADDLFDVNHFKRPIYHRLYRDAVDRLTGLAPRHATRADD